MLQVGADPDDDPPPELLDVEPPLDAEPLDDAEPLEELPLGPPSGVSVPVVFTTVLPPQEATAKAATN
jgi:hypothetical protein